MISIEWNSKTTNDGKWVWAISRRNDIRVRFEWMMRYNWFASTISDFCFAHSSHKLFIIWFTFGVGCWCCCCCVPSVRYARILPQHRNACEKYTVKFTRTHFVAIHPCISIVEQQSHVSSSLLGARTRHGRERQQNADTRCKERISSCVWEQREQTKKPCRLCARMKKPFSSAPFVVSRLCYAVAHDICSSSAVSTRARRGKSWLHEPKWLWTKLENGKKGKRKLLAHFHQKEVDIYHW